MRRCRNELANTPTSGAWISRAKNANAYFIECKAYDLRAINRIEVLLNRGRSRGHVRRAFFDCEKIEDLPSKMLGFVNHPIGSVRCLFYFIVFCYNKN